MRALLHNSYPMIFVVVSLLPAVATADIAGFGDFSGFTVNKNDAAAAPVTSPGKIQLTNQAFFNARSVFANAPQNITNFTASFTYQSLNASTFGDYGVTFCVQNSPAGVNAVGGTANGFGYSGISNSGAVSLEIGANSLSGFYSGGGTAGGGSPTSPVNLLSGHLINAVLSYNGSSLQESLTDATTGQIYTTSYPVNLVSLVGSSTAFVGFTGSTNVFGPSGADQYLSNFSFTGGSVPEPASGLLLISGASLLLLPRRKRALCGA